MSEIIEEEIKRALEAEALAFEPPEHLAGETLAAAEGAREPGRLGRMRGWYESRKLKPRGGFSGLAFAGTAVAVLLGLYAVGFMSLSARQGLDQAEDTRGSQNLEDGPRVQEGLPGGGALPRAQMNREDGKSGAQAPGCEGGNCGGVTAPQSGPPDAGRSMPGALPFGSGEAASRAGSGGQGGSGGGGGDSDALAQGPAASTVDRIGPGPAPLPGPAPNAAAGPGVIRTGEMEVRVKKGGFRDAWARAMTIAGKHGGFVAGSSADQVKGRLSRGMLTVRVPAANLDAAVADFQRLGRLVRLTSSSSDVSGQLVDFDARIRAAQARELQLLELLRQARSVADSLQVGTALSEVRTEIESLQAQRANLQSQVELASLNVSVYEPQAAPEPPRPLEGRLAMAWRSALDAGALTLSTIVIGAGFVLPLVLLGLIVWGGLRLRRRLALR